MTHMDIAQALAAAHRDDLMRMAHGRVHGPVKSPDATRRQDRFAAWVRAQVAGLRRPATARPAPFVQTPLVQAQCTAVTR